MTMTSIIPDNINAGTEQVVFPFLYTTGLLVAREELVSEHLRVSVHAGVDTHALYSANHLGHLALVDGPKTCEVGVVDHSRG